MRMHTRSYRRHIRIKKKSNILQFQGGYDEDDMTDILYWEN